MQTGFPVQGLSQGLSSESPESKPLGNPGAPKQQHFLLLAIDFIYGNCYIPKNFHLEESNILSYFVNSFFFS